MRTTKQWAGAAALSLITIFCNTTAHAAPNELEATALASSARQARSERTELVFAGMLALLAALLVLRRNSVETD